jgi:hypothetical protein
MMGGERLIAMTDVCRTMNTHAPSLFEPCNQLFQTLKCKLISDLLGRLILGIEKGVRVTSPIPVVALRCDSAPITNVEHLIRQIVRKDDMDMG